MVRASQRTEAKSKSFLRSRILDGFRRSNLQFPRVWASLGTRNCDRTGKTVVGPLVSSISARIGLAVTKLLKFQ